MPATPTLGEFIEKAEAEYGCRLRRAAVRAHDPDGEHQLSVLERPGISKVVIPDIPTDIRLSPHQLRSYCARLNIPPAEFGLNLD